MIDEFENLIEQFWNQQIMREANTRKMKIELVIRVGELMLRSNDQERAKAIYN